MVSLQKRVVKLQFLYMQRPQLKVKECFLQKLVKNIENLSCNESIKIKLKAIAIKTFGSKLENRIKLCKMALNLLNEGYQKNDN